MKKNAKFIFSGIFFIILMMSITDAKTIDCKDDFSCLVNYSSNCISSKVMNEESIQLFDAFNVTSKTFFKIRPYRDKCEFFYKIKYIKIKLTNELKIDLMNELNLTKWEVQKLEHDLNKEIRAMNQNKRALLCRFEIEELHTFLNKIDKGELTLLDFENASCK